MARSRLSTTVDQTLLDDARRILGASTDAQLIDEALKALVARHRSVQIDDAYARAYADQPLDAPDEWGDLASFRDVVSR